MSTIFSWNMSVEELAKTAETDEVRVPIINHLLKKSKILEGGAGLGRWCIYLQKLGYDIIGVEYSRESVNKVKKEYPDINMTVGDVSTLPFKDNTFEAYLSLGVIEHFYKGPEEPLSAMYEVLAPEGIAIITVPAVNLSRRFSSLIYQGLSSPIHTLVLLTCPQSIIRRILALLGLGNEPIATNEPDNYRRLLKNSRKGLAPRFIVSRKGVKFYEYRFPKNKLNAYLTKIGFEIILMQPIYHKDGLYHSLGRTVGSASKAGEVKLNAFGKVVNAILRRISEDITNHMWLYVVRKRTGEASA